MVKLTSILKLILSEATDKSILTSNPGRESMQKFHETTQRLMKLLQNSQIMEREVLYNKDTGDNVFTPSMVSKGDVVQHLGEYQGQNFKEFTQKISQLYEKAGFKVEQGYGMDDINGFEVKSDDGEVIGEVDFLIKNSIPNMSDTIIVKHKKQ